MDVQLPQLPEAVIASILQQVLPLRARLQCALVCKAWAAAIVATTADLDAELSSCIRWEHVQDWLEQHAGQVSTISFSHHGHSKQPLQLPGARLSKLQKLHVDSMTMCLQDTGPQHTSPSTALNLQDSILSEAFSRSCVLVSTRDSAAGSASQHVPAGAALGAAAAPAGPVLALLPKLQRLELFSCAASLQDILLLSQATGLTSLNLYNTTVTADSTSTSPAIEEQLTVAMSAVLQGLTGLSELGISLMGFSQHALCPISRMQGLQSLQLYISTDDEHTDSFLAALPASLTALQLKDMSVTPSPAVAQQLSSLSNLQSLRLEELDLDPSVLGSCTGLQCLVLDAVYLLPPAPQVGVLCLSACHDR
jgi:hypothetical protein